ncbi:metallophosphoesterase [Yokenella regensburgei]|uniref:metallophosphoesterase n=1 Tax=Yokenella regensburgei TaxID=158877 RepID=UPI003F169B7F
MFFLWTLLPALYIAFRFIWRLSLPVIPKLLFTLLVVLICQFHFISRMLWGNMFSPEWPRPAMIAIGTLFGATVLFAGLLLLRDLAALLIRLLTRKRLPFLPVSLPMLAGAVALSGIGVWQAIQVPAVRTVEVSITGLPPAFEGYRIVQLADIHATRLLPREWVEQIVAKTNALKPDLIALTGDMSDGTLGVRYSDVEPLAHLRAADGVFAITGNHEYYFDYQEWIPAWQKLGIPFLMNSHVRIAKGDSSLVLAGVTDKIAKRFGFDAPNIERALQGTTANDTIILLDHRPDTAEKNAAYGVRLQLSGHTHGGMVRGLDEAVKAVNGGFVSGRYQVGNMTLYVSNGAGLWSGFPLRLGRPSEITEIIMHVNK